MCATHCRANGPLEPTDSHSARAPHAKIIESGFAALFVLQLERKFGSLSLCYFC